MLRVFSLTIAGLALAATVALAAEYRGYLKSVGTNKITVTVAAEDKEKDKDAKDKEKAAKDKDPKEKEKDVEIKTDAGTKFFSGKEASSSKDLAKLLKDSEGKGVRVRVTTKGSGPAEVATEVRFAGKRSKGEKE